MMPTDTYKLPDGRDYDESVRRYYIEMKQGQGVYEIEDLENKPIAEIIEEVREDLKQVLGLTDNVLARWREWETAREKVIEQDIYATNFEHFFSIFPREVLKLAVKDEEVKSRLIELYKHMLDRNEVGDYAQIGLHVIDASILLDPRLDGEKLVKIIGTFTPEEIRAIGSRNLVCMSNERIDDIKSLIIDEYDEDTIPKVLKEIGTANLLSMTQKELAQRVKEIDSKLFPDEQ